MEAELKDGWFDPDATAVRVQVVQAAGHLDRQSAGRIATQLPPARATRFFRSSSATRCRITCTRSSPGIASTEWSRAASIIRSAAKPTSARAGKAGPCTSRRA